ncbi:MAG: hypothetical protein AAF682_07435 [Planctomycetota bacterium]
MKRTIVLPAAALATALALPLASFVAPQEAGEEQAEEYYLEDEMLNLEDHLGKLRRAIRDESKVAECLTAVAGMQDAVMKCKLLTPPRAADLPEDKRAAYVADYRKMLIGLLQDQLALEAALLDGDFDTAKELFKKIRAMEETGHERFMGEEG